MSDETGSSAFTQIPHQLTQLVRIRLRYKQVRIARFHRSIHPLTPRDIPSSGLDQPPLSLHGPIEAPQLTRYAPPIRRHLRAHDGEALNGARVKSWVGSVQVHEPAGGITFKRRAIRGLSDALIVQRETKDELR